MATINRLLVGLFISGALMAQNQLVINPITGMWDLVNNAASPSGGAVGGASAVAAGQVLFGVSPGVAGSELGFTYDPTSDRAAIGPVRIGSYTGNINVGALYMLPSPTNNNYTLQGSGNDVYLNSAATTGLLAFAQGNTERARFAATTGNLLLNSTVDDGTNRLQVAGSVAVTGTAGPNVIVRSTGVGSVAQVAFLRQSDAGNRGSVGYSNTLDTVFLGNATARVLSITQNSNALVGTDTDGNFRLDIGSSGSSGTLRAWNQAIGGATQVVFRAGDTQVGANLTTWQNSGGGAIAYVASDGGLGAVSYVVGTDYGANGVALLFKNSYVMQWSSTSSFAGSRDLVVDRQAAGVLRISNTGTTGGGLLIEGLKSTTGTRYVCVDTTGRFTSSATACSGT
jgi:hypothetical protein